MDKGQKAVEDIREGDMLISVDGLDVEVKSIVRHSSIDRQMVMLETASFQVLVTFNHRVVIRRGGSEQTIPAGHLKIGDSVLCSDGEKSLVQVQHFFGEDDVYEMVLFPDASMETFFLVGDRETTLLTKGKGVKRERGYIRKK